MKFRGLCLHCKFVGVLEDGLCDKCKTVSGLSNNKWSNEAKEIAREILEHEKVIPNADI